MSFSAARKLLEKSVGLAPDRPRGRGTGTNRTYPESPESRLAIATAQVLDDKPLDGCKAKLDELHRLELLSLTTPVSISQRNAPTSTDRHELVESPLDSKEHVITGLDHGGNSSTDQRSRRQDRVGGEACPLTSVQGKNMNLNKLLWKVLSNFIPSGKQYRDVRKQIIALVEKPPMPERDLREMLIDITHKPTNVSSIVETWLSGHRASQPSRNSRQHGQERRLCQEEQKQHRDCSRGRNRSSHRRRGHRDHYSPRRDTEQERYGSPYSPRAKRVKFESTADVTAAVHRGNSGPAEQQLLQPPPSLGPGYIFYPYPPPSLSALPPGISAPVPHPVGAAHLHGDVRGQVEAYAGAEQAYPPAQHAYPQQPPYGYGPGFYVPFGGAPDFVGSASFEAVPSSTQYGRPMVGMETTAAAQQLAGLDLGRPTPPVSGIYVRASTGFARGTNDGAQCLVKAPNQTDSRAVAGRGGHSLTPGRLTPVYDDRGGRTTAHFTPKVRK